MGGGGGLNTQISFHGYVTCTHVKKKMSLLSWHSKFKKTPLEAESESSLSVGPTDTCSVLQSVEPEDATRQANDCSSATNSGTSTTSLIDLSTPLQSSITPLESAQSLLPQSAHLFTFERLYSCHLVCHMLNCREQIEAYNRNDIHTIIVIVSYQ